MVEHRESEDEVVFSLVRIGTRVFYYVDELLELDARFAVGKRR